MRISNILLLHDGVCFPKYRVIAHYEALQSNSVLSIIMTHFWFQTHRNAIIDSDKCDDFILHNCK